MIIDDIAQRIVSSFNAANSIELKEETMRMLRQIEKGESMFSVVNNPYLVAKSLYFMLTEDYLSVDNQMSVVKLCYLCVLKNIIKNIDKYPGDLDYQDLVSGSKLAIVLISMQNQYLMYSLISGQANYVNPDTHIRNQILLFGGIAKEAQMANCNFYLEDVINRYFVDTFKELYSHLPIGNDLSILKKKAVPIIENIATSISINLKDSWFDDY